MSLKQYWSNSKNTNRDGSRTSTTDILVAVVTAAVRQHPIYWWPSVTCVHDHMSACSPMVDHSRTLPFLPYQKIKQNRNIFLHQTRPPFRDGIREGTIPYARSSECTVNKKALQCKELIMTKIRTRISTHKKFVIRYLLIKKMIALKDTQVTMFRHVLCECGILQNGRILYVTSR